MHLWLRSSAPECLICVFGITQLDGLIYISGEQSVGLLRGWGWPKLNLEYTKPGQPGSICELLRLSKLSQAMFVGLAEVAHRGMNGPTLLDLVNKPMQLGLTAAEPAWLFGNVKSNCGDELCDLGLCCKFVIWFGISVFFPGRWNCLSLTKRRWWKGNFVSVRLKSNTPSPKRGGVGVCYRDSIGVSWI